MYCITREDMKFGDYFVPARTKARVVNKPYGRSVNAAGISLTISVDLFDMHPNKHTGVKMSEVKLRNELEPDCMGGTRTSLTGITLSTHIDQVYMDAGDEFYKDVTVNKWQLEKLFPAGIPEILEPDVYKRGFGLTEVIELLEEGFGEWVQQNCHFRKLTKKDIECGGCIDGAEPGDKTLSDKGLEQFEEKKLEYQKRLEAIGFTYDFKGGLIWE